MSKTMPRAQVEVTGNSGTYRSPEAETDDPLIGLTGDDIRALALRRAVWDARRLGRPVQLVTSGDYGAHRIIVTPDGTITGAALESDFEEFTGPAPRSAVRDIAASLTIATISGDGQNLEDETAAITDSIARAGRRPTFISPESPTVGHSTLASGLRRIGLEVKPTRSQARHAANVQATSWHWGGCRSVAVANGKGGVGKTMTSAMLAAVFARHGGGGVLAWDNNDTRGTLGWRTEAGSHGATIEDALTAATHLLAPDTGAAQIASYVHHQTQDRYDVLRSNPRLLAASQRIGQAQFDELMEVAVRYFRLVVFDSGNDESADRWLRMIDFTHQLVVPTLVGPESAESAALLLEALTERDEHSATLARDAVVIVTESERGSTAETRSMASAFENLVRAVAVIPFDPALKSGPLRFDALRPPTQRAWVAAGAAVAAGLH